MLIFYIFILGDEMRIYFVFIIKDEYIELIAQRGLIEGNPLYPVPKIMNLEECKAIIKKLQK